MVAPPRGLRALERSRATGRLSHGFGAGKRVFDRPRKRFPILRHSLGELKEFGGKVDGAREGDAEFARAEFDSRAKPGTGSPNTAYLVRLQNGSWTRTKLPWRINPVKVAGDGHGGVWLTALGTGTGWFVHRSATGRWSRVLAGSPAAVFGLTLIPGTGALWSVGDRGASAAIWAFGRTG